MTATFEETGILGIDLEIPCEALLESGGPCPELAEARVSYACPVPGCLARSFVFICASCLKCLHEHRVRAVCPVHGTIVPVLVRML